MVEIDQDDPSYVPTPAGRIPRGDDSLWSTGGKQMLVMLAILSVLVLIAAAYN